MNKLSLKLKGNRLADCIVRVDGKIAKFDKNEYGSRMYVLDTDKDEVDISITNIHELDSPVWFLTSTLFSIISVYGLFDVRYDKRPAKLDYHGKIKLNEMSDLTLTINSFDPTKKIFTAEGNCEIEDNESNIYIYNSKIKKRLKIVGWVRFLLFLLTIGIIMLFLTR